jgi:hypothetical protein
LSAKGECRTRKHEPGEHADVSKRLDHTVRPNLESIDKVYFFNTHLVHIFITMDHSVRLITHSRDLILIQSRPQIHIRPYRT